MTLLGRLCGWPLVVLALAAHFLIAVSSVREKSATYDEVAHVTSGYSYWTRNDYGLKLEGITGHLPQRWFALPLVTMDLKFPDDKDQWTKTDIFTVGKRFFFKCGNDADALLWRARCMNAILSVGLGLLVYVWSRRLFGAVGGTFSLLLYAMDPTVLANGSLATSDLATAAFFTLSVGCLWKMFHRVSLGNVVGCWLALAGLLLSKMSGIIVVPMAAALLILKLAERRPLTVAWKQKEIVLQRWPAQAGVLLGIALLQVLLVAGAIWAAYGFHYSALHRSPETEALEQSDRDEWQEALSDADAFGKAIELARDYRLLPEPFLFGTAHIYHAVQSRPAFLNGEYSTTGWWYFFPYTFLVKTPLATLAILLLAAAGAVWGWRRECSDSGNTLRQVVWQAFYATAPLWVFLAVYWAVAVNSRLNIGHRHLLPTYPAMFILAGAIAHWFHQHDRLGRTISAVAVVCAILLAVDCGAMYPHYLAYFNRIAGGPHQGYKHLVDSSLDWGQDLPGLKQWLDEHQQDGRSKDAIYSAFPDGSDPEHYQVHAKELCPIPVKSLAPWSEGVFCLSATELQCVYQLTPGPWTAKYEADYRQANTTVQRLKNADPAEREQMMRARGKQYWEQQILLFVKLRFCRLCAFLRQREPDDNVGYSILIYRLSAKDIHDAIFGPPFWLDPTLGPVEDSQ